MSEPSRQQKLATVRRSIVAPTFRHPDRVQEAFDILSGNVFPRQTQLSLNLGPQPFLSYEGLFPVVIQNKKYYFPILFLLSADFPESPPSVSIVPTLDMYIVSHPNVASDGTVSLPSLTHWDSSSSIEAVLLEMSSSFSTRSPLVCFLSYSMKSLHLQS